MHAMRALLLALVAGLGGCGNLQTVPIAAVASDVVERPLGVSETRPAKDDVVPNGYEVEGRSLFVEQTAGGSAGVGLLFGPLGVLANRLNIDRLTREMGESGVKSSLYSIDALETAKAIWGGRVTASSGGAAVLLKPYVYVLVNDDKVGINTLAAVRAEGERGEGQKPWIGNYYYCLAEALPMTALQGPMAPEQITAYRAAIGKGFAELLAEIQRDFSRAPAPARDIAWVVSPTCMNFKPGMPGNLERDASGRMTMRSMFGDFGRVYNVFIFPTSAQYRFDNGPVPRESK
jgi:hypothetical protein